MVRGREMFVEGQDSMKKELIKRFLTENFSWIDDIFTEDDNEEQEAKERQEDENNPPPLLLPETM